MKVFSVEGLIIVKSRSGGSDIRIKMKLSLEEIAKGLEKTIKLKRSALAKGVQLKTCPTCNGSGQVTTVQNTILGQMRSASVCPHCGGSGKVVGKDHLSRSRWHG